MFLQLPFIPTFATSYFDPRLYRYPNYIVTHPSRTYKVIPCLSLSLNPAFTLTYPSYSHTHARSHTLISTSICSFSYAALWGKTRSF